MVFLSFVLISIAIIGLILIPIIFEKPIARIESNLIDLEKSDNEFKRAREKSHMALKEYDELMMIHEIYLNLPRIKHPMPFIKDNIEERLREAARLIGLCSPNLNEFLTQINQMTVDELNNSIAENELIFSEKHDEILSQISSFKMKKNKKESYKRIVLYICIVLNIVGLSVGFYNARQESKERIEFQQKIFERLKANSNNDCIK